MLSSEEYEQLKPDRENIFRFMETGKYTGDKLQTVDEIMQHRGHKGIDFGCQGCKAAALTDIYHLMVEYEREVLKV